MSQMDGGPSAFGMAQLTHVDLGNHNAGEGGRQLADLKTVGNRPYISGQAYRHAIKDALRDLTADGVDCTPRHACGEISTCKLCDLFGYMNTDLGEDDPQPKRVSPLRVTPLVGQYDRPVTTDMILQYGVEDEEGDLDNRIGYREMTENVFKNALCLDIDAVGRREAEATHEDGGRIRYSREFRDEITADERAARVQELLAAIQNTTQLAGQARHMADFMPDLLVAATFPTYNQRVTNALHVDRETGDLDTATFESVLVDLVEMGADVWVAGTRNPTVINNWEAVFDITDATDGVQMVDSVVECFKVLGTTLSDGT